MSSLRPPFRLTIVAAAIAAALSAHAQEAPKDAAPKAAAVQAAPADAKINTVEVRGAAGAYDPRRDDTASRIVVNHDEIVKYGDTSVLDVLKRVPGVTVSGANGRGGEIQMRGLGSGYTQILINGERAPAGFSIDSLSPDVIEKIEVLRAASAEYSTQSIAGTINIVLKKAVKTAQRELKTGYASGAGFRSPTVNLQLSDKAGKLSYSLSANVFQQRFERESPTVEEGYDLAGHQVLQRDSAVRDHGHMLAMNLSPRLNWTLDGGDTLTSQTFFNINRFQRSSTGTTSTPLGAAPPYPSQDTSMTNDNEFLRSDLAWAHKLESGSKLDLKIGGVIGKLANTQYRFGTGNPGFPEMHSVIESKGTDRGLTSTGKYTNPLWDGHALAIGWDAGYNTRDDSRREADYRQPDVPIPGGDESYRSRVARLAMYAQDEWNVTARWSVYLGTRWEGIQTRTEGNTFDTAHSRSSVWSPLFQTLWKLPGTKADQLRFAVTRTYKAPDLQSLIPHRFTSVNNSQVAPDFQGNPNLKPELALGMDASYEHYWGQGALLSVSASMRRIEDNTRNMIEFDDGRWVSRPMNVGKAQTRGLELEAKFPLKSVLASAPAIDVRASVSRNWSSVDFIPGPDNRLANQTPLSATFGLDYKIGALTTGGSFAFKTGGPLRLAANQTAYETVRRDLDLYALWKFSPKTQLRVAASNILSQDYITERSYVDPQGELRSRSIFPGVANVRATLETKF